VAPDTDTHTLTERERERERDLGDYGLVPSDFDRPMMSPNLQISAHIASSASPSGLCLCAIVSFFPFCPFSYGSRLLHFLLVCFHTSSPFFFWYRKVIWACLIFSICAVRIGFFDVLGFYKWCVLSGIFLNVENSGAPIFLGIWVLFTCSENVGKEKEIEVLKGWISPSLSLCLCLCLSLALSLSLSLSLTFLHYLALHWVKAFTPLNSQDLKSVLVSIDLLRL
jgi:hypothetical protein